MTHRNILHTGLVIGGAAVLFVVFLLGFVGPSLHASSATIVIAEFRTRGPNGAADEFVELFNKSNGSVDLSLWRVSRSSSTAVTATLAVIPTGTILAAGQHFLLTNNAGYSGTVTGNLTYTLGVADNGGIGLLNPAGHVIDAVGMSSGSAYLEQNPLTPMAGTANQSYERKPGAPGLPQQDTDDNMADFRHNSGVSYPENLASPTAPTAVTLRDFVAEATGNGILLTWKTADERALQGFNLYRSTAPTDPGDKLNTDLILAQAPDSPVGSTYTWLDTRQPMVGTGIYYWLEAIDLNGASARTGPITVAASPGSARQFYLPFVVR